MSAELMQQNQEYEFEARNPRPGYKRLKAGDIFTWNLEIGEDVWTALKTLPDNAIIDVRFYFHEGDEPQPDDSTEPIDLRIKPMRKKDKPKGPWGKFWNELCVKGVFHNFDLQTAIQYDTGEDVYDYEQGLRDIFKVTSRTFISPDEFDAWLEKHELSGLITMSRQASAKVDTHLATKGETA